MSFHVYAAIVKNLRGVLYSSAGPDEFSEKLSWLRRKFRYRSLGLPPSMFERYREIVEGKLGPKLLRLEAPLSGLDELISAYEGLTGLGYEVLEAYCYASLYVSPLMVLGEACVPDLAPLVVGRVPVGRELTDRDYKLHMRIADYTVLDFYLWATSSAEEAIRAISEGGSAEGILRERKGRVEEDKRRYWRIISEEGRPIILYLDLLPLLAERLSTEEAGRLLKEHGSLVPATLALVSAIVI